MPESTIVHDQSGIASRRPRVTVGVPVYNDAAFIRQALQDLTDQTFRDFEIIISDNASTDETSDICRAYANQNPAVRYYRQEKNTGARENIKFVLQEARGQYFTWAASDDRRTPDFLMILAAELDAQPKSASAFCRFVNIDSGNRILEEFNFDFSGSNAFVRLAKFMLSRNRRKDVMFYGLHRTQILKQAKFYIWWVPNEATILRTAYPIVAHLLAHGYRHVDRLLFRSRMDPDRPRVHYLPSGKNRWHELVSNNLLEINVQYAIIESACRALRSITIIPLLLLLSLLSLLRTIVVEIIFRVVGALSKLRRRQNRA